MNLRYLMRIASGVKLEVFKECAEECARRSGINKALIIADMLACIPKYGAGHHDYMLFEFYNLNAQQRATYMTRVKNKKMLDRLNDPAFVRLVDNKASFNRDYDEFLHREWLDIRNASDQELKDFLGKMPVVFAKPDESESGKGIERLVVTDFPTLEDAVSYVRDPAKRFRLLEEPIVQHEELNRLYPHSVNCMRMVTIVNEGKPHAIYAVLKTGNHGKFVDNLENGGYACHVDMDTGVVVGPGHTNKMDLVEEHPYTGVKFVGFKIPFFKEACEMIEKAAMVHPEVGCIGWDVCITPDGPAIIEGNPYSGYDFPQLPDYSQPKEGYIKMIYDRSGFVV